MILEQTSKKYLNCGNNNSVKFKYFFEYMEKSEQFARNLFKLGIFFTFVLLGEGGGNRDVYMPIWLQESHLKSDGFIFFFRCNPKWNPSPFFCNSSRMESQENPKRFFLESFRQLLESHTSSSIFSGILCLFCVFQMGLGNRYLGRQKLVRLLVSSSV